MQQQKITYVHLVLLINITRNIRSCRTFGIINQHKT